MAAGPSGKYYNIYTDTCTRVNDPSDGLLFVRIAGGERLAGRPNLSRDDGGGGGKSVVVAVIGTIYRALHKTFDSFKFITHGNCVP